MITTGTGPTCRMMKKLTTRPSESGVEFLGRPPRIAASHSRLALLSAHAPAIQQASAPAPHPRECLVLALNVSRHSPTIRLGIGSCGLRQYTTLAGRWHLLLLTGNESFQQLGPLLKSGVDPWPSEK
jgi:hypothetical protein